jgi:hypothetical protein
MGNVCTSKLTVIGLTEAPESFVKALSKAIFAIDLDNLEPEKWGHAKGVDGRTWYGKLVNEYRQNRDALSYILYPLEPYQRLGVSAPQFFVRTKGAPPESELKQASKVFPDLTFHLDWWVQQDGPSGEVVIRNGHDIDAMYRPASWYLFDDAVLYPRISLLTAHLPFTLAQRAVLRVEDAIQSVEGLAAIMEDRRFTDSPYEGERDSAAVDETWKLLQTLLSQMRMAAGDLTFQGVFLEDKPFRHQERRPSKSQVGEESEVNMDGL